MELHDHLRVLRERWVPVQGTDAHRTCTCAYRTRPVSGVLPDAHGGAAR